MANSFRKTHVNYIRSAFPGLSSSLVIVFLVLIFIRLSYSTIILENSVSHFLHFYKIIRDFSPALFLECFLKIYVRKTIIYNFWLISVIHPFIFLRSITPGHTTVGIFIILFICTILTVKNYSKTQTDLRPDHESNK